jgi:hypothetical protein
MIFAVLAIVATGLFAGAALYINLVEHPARMECGTELAAAEFPPSYRRASVLQATLAAVGLASGLGAWLALDRAALLIASILIGAVIPFTLIVVFPTNRRLLDPELDRSSPATTRLLDRWQRLHAVRTVLSITALIVLAWSTLQAS